MITYISTVDKWKIKPQPQALATNAIFNRNILEIFSDSIVDKFTAVVNNFCTVIYIVNILAFSTDIKT